MDPWANANTYAPWMTPNGVTGENPSFGNMGGSYGRTLGSGTGALAGGLGGLGVGIAMSGGAAAPLTLPLAGLGSLFGLLPSGKGKKRIDPNFSAPSYQGTAFTPQEGLPAWYTDNDPNTHMYSMEGGMMNAATMSPPQTANAPQPYQQTNTSMPFNGTMPSYVGQNTPDYAAMTGLSPMSLGGYGSYGGYGASGNQNSNSTYQPYVPTGYSNVGQY